MENKKGGELIGRRPEAIIEARFKLTKKQNDIVDMVFASIEDDGKLEYQIDVNKYGKLYNIKDKSNVYRDFKKAVATFEGKGFSLSTKNKDNKEHRIYFSWFSSIDYIDGESKIVLELGQKLKTLMLSAKKACFYQLKYTLNFNNIYSKRLYYYLKSYENSSKNGTGWRIDNLDELRIKLECPKSYGRYADFKRFVLKPAYEEINGSSDISFEYEETKIKGKVINLKFYIKANKSNTRAIDEICATTESKSTDEEEKRSTELINKIKAVFKEDITTIQAKSILDTAKGNIHIIKEKYDLSQNIAKIDSIVGWIIKAIKEDYQPPKGKVKVGSFNDYEQRSYDFDELEKKLLGWDNKGE
jgi:plasmid replication initiation protein